MEEQLSRSDFSPEPLLASFLKLPNAGKAVCHSLSKSTHSFLKILKPTVKVIYSSSSQCVKGSLLHTPHSPFL